MREKWWLYGCLAVCDIEANFLVVLAYQYTYLSSVMLLDCFSIPCVMVLGRLLLGRRFHWIQLIGVVLCVGGVAALLASDWTSSAFGQTEASNPLLGDGLCLVAAVLYAVSNTGQEMAVSRAGSKLEYLAMLSLFATPLSAAQAAGIDHRAWVSLAWSVDIGLLLAGFAVCLFFVYALVPLALEREGATFLNLSLLTSDVFAVIAGIFLFGYKMTFLYIIAAILIVIGLIVYNIQPPQSAATEGESYEPVEESINDIS